MQKSVLGALGLVLSLSLNAMPLSAQQVQPVLGAAVEPAKDADSSLKGTLEVTADVVGAGVLLDGQPVGQAPLTLQGVMGGLHTVQLAQAGQAPAQEVLVIPGTVAHVALLAAAPAPESHPESHAATPAKSEAPSPLVRGWGVVAGIPWGFGATTLAVTCLAAWALLWPMQQGNLPAVAGLRLRTDDNTWKALQWVPMVGVVGFGVLAVMLFTLPAIPFSQWMPQNAV